MCDLLGVPEQAPQLRVRGVEWELSDFKVDANVPIPTQVHLAAIVRNDHRVSKILFALEQRGAPSQFCP
ncbi:hypothetical protein DEO72_LG10g3260 [Vigna unguiculata]|uniref:Uncharacterized protein n=1 Tax=Vigna unguiculata TaxID=3917 RepID=A0A4D6NGE9_VIGUN|nr:hypothetical protein DEO72_LG10g3260 [Vigna unguiculata]